MVKVLALVGDLAMPRGYCLPSAATDFRTSLAALQSLLRAEARELETAIAFLQQAATCLEHGGITINDPIPMTMTRVANVDRAQLLIECPSRPALQAFLTDWMAVLRTIKTRAKWSLEVDPVDI